MTMNDHFKIALNVKAKNKNVMKMVSNVHFKVLGVHETSQMNNVDNSTG